MRAAMIAALALAAASPAAAQDGNRGEAQLTRILDGRTAGEPVDCILLRQIRNTTIVPGEGVVYRMNNGTLYLNRANGTVGANDDNDILVTRTIGTQLCAVDSVTLIDRYTQFFSGVIQLGDFIPYTRPDRS